MSRRACLLAVLALILCASVACGGGSNDAGGGSKPTVATSSNVLADFITNVVGDRAEVLTLVPDDRSPNTYEPAPQDAVTLARARVFFANGLYYEDTLRKLFENTKSLQVVTLSDGLRLKETAIDHGDHGHRFQNPYLYLDARNAIAYVEKIRDTMAGLDPANAETYRQNAAAYITQLEELDEWIASEIARIPQEQRRLMKDHASFPYYADRYGLLDFAASYEGTAEAAPTPSQYVTLINQVRQFNISVVFGEEGYSSRLMQQLANDTGIRFVSGLRAATLGTAEETNTYLEMMRHNTRLLVEHLS
jgi:ABC-type Zn uptake system ZnuABC Zn-binding protein ZnuA